MEQNKNFTYNQLKKYRNLFGCSENQIDLGELLKRVLLFDPNTCDFEYEFSYDDFMNTVYLKGIESVEKGLGTLKNNLLKGVRFQFVHGQGKNGKTTTLRRLMKESGENNSFVYINYKNDQINRVDFSHDLFTQSINDFIELNSLFGDDFVLEVKKCLLRISTHQLRVSKKSLSNAKRNGFNRLFQNLRLGDDNLIDFIARLENESQVVSDDFHNKLAHLFGERFEKQIEKIIEKRTKMGVAIDLFNLLLLVSVSLYSKEDKRVVFIIDNLDDILTNKAEYFSAKIIPTVAIFFNLIKTYINREKDVFINEELLAGISFVFSYRSTNYVSSMVALKSNQSVAEHRDELTGAPTVVIDSIHESGDILLLRLEFYKKLCNDLNISLSQNYHIIKSLIASFLNARSDEDYVFSVFRLWNGNRNSFITGLSAFLESVYWHTIIVDPKVPVELKHGSMVYFITRYYNGLGEQLIPHPTITSAFRYSFKNSVCTDGKICPCNMLRMFLSYIIEHQTANPKANNSIDEYYANGVSLWDLLEAFSKFRNDIGERVYTKSVFKSLFENVFYEDIDSWGYFITCVKEMGNEELAIKKKYDFDHELDIYFDNKSLSDKVIDELKEIKFYHNKNAPYFLKHVKRHFEYFYATKTKVQHPLSYNIRVFSIDKKLLKYECNFTNHVIGPKHSVFIDVKASVINTISFYFDHVYNHHPPKNYCKDSNFALNHKFYYCDLIPRHIAYIEYIRLSVIKFKTVSFEYQVSYWSDENLYANSHENEPRIEVMRDLNKSFIEIILKYLNLFTTSYRLFHKKIKTGEIDPETVSTNISLKKLREKVDIIIESGYLDFITEITSKYEK